MRNDTTCGKIYRTSTGDLSDWHPVMQNGFGNLQNVKVESLVVYSNTLLAMTFNSDQGMEVWTSDNGTAWNLQKAGEFGNQGNQNSLWNSAQAIYNNSLFVGTYNHQSGGQVWELVPNVIFLPSIYRK